MISVEVAAKSAVEVSLLLTHHQSRLKLFAAGHSYICTVDSSNVQNPPDFEVPDSVIFTREGSKLGRQLFFIKEKKAAAV